MLFHTRMKQGFGKQVISLYETHSFKNLHGFSIMLLLAEA